ncbi:hypothetical protein FBU59_005980 [Linderina macrospora]|uniref:Uncharacterized protein n=1 Tax=Linderina macrospora TaxID=4868 RepID=A0ACC1J197_9FUNG|nr:hypothetical protein FBU59_005980 [Linderina macrospora]
MLLSLASLLVNASLLVGINEHLQQHPGLSAAAFLRHFTPLCTLVLLLLWPVLEAPVDMLETVWLGPTSALRVVLSCVGVAILGALSYVAKVALLKSAVSDGPVGVAMVGQIHTIVCLAIGWWSYGYAHWGLQVLGFYIAVGCLAVWAVSRITTNVGDLVPVLSSHSFKTTRSRKYSSAIF